MRRMAVIRTSILRLVGGLVDRRICGLDVRRVGYERIEMAFGW